MVESVHVLFVMSARETARLASDAFSRAGFNVIWLHVSSLEAFLSSFSERDWDLIVCEERLRDFDVTDVLAEAGRREPAVPVIVLLEEETGPRIIQLFRSGASDCVRAGDMTALAGAARDAILKLTARRKEDSADRELAKYRTYLEDLVNARSDALKQANRRLEAEIELHRQTVRALQASEETFRAVAESAPDIISRFDRTFRHLYVNPAVEGAGGVTRADFLGKTIVEAGVPGETARALEQTIEKVFTTGQVHSTYLDFPSPKGTRTYHFRLAPEFSTDDRVESVVSIARDITDTRNAEVALRRSEASFRTLSENAPCIIIRLGPDMRIVHANPASKELTGQEPSSIQGKRLDEIGLPRRPYRLIASMFRRTYRSRHRGDLKATVELRGAPRTFDVIMVPEQSATGEVESVLAIAHDMTEAEEAQRVLAGDKVEIQQLVEERTAELVATQMELVEAKRLSDIGTLAATVAHELRNPLAVIQTAAYNLRRKRKDRALDSHLAAIDRKVAESDQIINNLLNYSRLKQSQPKTTDVFKLIEEHLASARKRHSGHTVRIFRRTDPIRKRKFAVDADQIGEVFANILNNAYDALENAHGRITVSAQADPKNGSLTISFTDNGQGMTEAELGRAMDPFFTTKSKGTGLGLSICRDIVRLHGGSMSIDGSLGKGTTVTITLPLE